MAQKLGLLITNPFNNEDLGTKLLRVDPKQEFRDLSAAEFKLIKELTDAMAITGADWTDTFRLLAEVVPGASEQPVLEKILNICAPAKLTQKVPQSKYSPA